MASSSAPGTSPIPAIRSRPSRITSASSTRPRKKVSQLKLDFDAPLPSDQVAGLGQRIRIGQLEIEPVSVEKRPLTIIKTTKTAGEPQRRTTRFDALVLRMRVKNTSQDSPIYPLDPAFSRARRMDDIPAMRLAIGRLVLYGGRDLLAVRRQGEARVRGGAGARRSAAQSRRDARLRRLHERGLEYRTSCQESDRAALVASPGSSRPDRVSRARKCR